MTITVVKGLLNRLEAQNSNSPTNLVNSSYQLQAQASRTVAQNAAVSSDAVMTTLRANKQSAAEHGKPIASEKEAHEVADGIADEIRSKDDGSAEDVHSFSGSEGRNLA